MYAHEDDLRTTPLTPIQFDRARTLARRYGHTWGDTPDTHPDGGPWTIARIDDWNNDQFEPDGSMRGIRCPSGVYASPLSDTMIIVHTTGRQRLTWSVCADGSVVLEINRPKGIALTAMITPDLTVTIEPGDVPIYERHRTALVQALYPFLDGPATIRTALKLAALDAETLPDPDGDLYGAVPCWYAHGRSRWGYLIASAGAVLFLGNTTIPMEHVDEAARIVKALREHDLGKQSNG